MAKPGRKRTPTKELQLRGSWKAKGRSDVEIDSTVPICPDKITGEARKFWFQIVPEMTKMGILSAIDTQSLANLCRVHAEIIKLESQAVFPLIKHEYKNERGEVTKTTFEDNKMYYAYWKAIDRFNKMKADFFMSPADRAGMGNAQIKEKDNEKARFFNKNA